VRSIIAISCQVFRPNAVATARAEVILYHTPAISVAVGRRDHQPDGVGEDDVVPFFPLQQPSV
jgi:glutamate formiminotransferase